MATRAVAWMWALFWAAVGITGFTSGDPTGTIVAGVILCVMLGAPPALLHHLVWPSENAQRRKLQRAGTDPSAMIVRPQGVAAASPGQGVGAGDELTALERVHQLADELRGSGVLPKHDHRAVRDRAAELRHLVLVDQRSVALGGTISPVLRREVMELHDRLVSLLDASIDAAAATPAGDAVEARLDDHLQALQGRSRAIEELRQLESHLRDTGDLGPRGQPGTAQ